MKLISCLSSVVIIVFSGLYLYHENITPDWRHHQLTYFETIRSQSNSSTTPNANAYPLELSQIWLPAMNRIDRCISCHAAIEDSITNHNENPLKVHPKNYFNAHDPQKYGCTICHDGQGRAINFKDVIADSPDVFWNKPLLKKPFIEANCYRCHIDSLDQTPAYNRGKQKFETTGCLGCHKRDDKGGFAGSELRGIGDASIHIKYPKKTFDPKILSQLNRNQNLAYIYEAVRFPKAQSDETRMLDFKMSHEDTMVLTVYLKSLFIYPMGTQRLPIKPVYPLPITEKGKKIFQLYCTACHGKDGRGGVKNPNFISDFIPKLSTLSEQMFLYKKKNQDAIISILNEYADLLEAGAQPEISGYFKVVAKYMPVKNTIENGRVVEKKNPEGATPLNMPIWSKTLSKKDISSVIAYLISIY